MMSSVGSKTCSDFRWQVASRSETAKALASSLKIPVWLAQSLLNRGISSVDQAAAWFNPLLKSLSDPFLLPNMGIAVERLLRAHAHAERILLFGDYDVDGITSTALLYELLTELGFQVGYYLPNRFGEGYGLSDSAVESCLQEHSPQLLIAVDCGSSSWEVIRQIQALSIDVIVLDHHQPSNPAPPAKALVNPLIDPGTATQFGMLCTAGLAFKLAHGLVKQARSLGWSSATAIDLRKYLDLVALGTVADMVRIEAENRILVRAGLARLSNTERVGLTALKAVAGCMENIGTSHISFQLAPRLNAAGRLQHAQASLELLLEKDPARARTLAEFLDLQNKERQTIEAQIVHEVIGAIRKEFDPKNDYVIVQGEDQWHVGVVGIVAAKVLREFHRPTIILGKDGDRWRGSGRSIDGFDLAAALRECNDQLLQHGGHAMAAGLSMDPTRLVEFRSRFNQVAKSKLDLEELRPLLKADSEVHLHELSLASFDLLSQFEPHGLGNPEVHLIARNLSVTDFRRMGKEQQHARFYVREGDFKTQVVWWRCPAGIELPDEIDLLFTPGTNIYNGTASLQLTLRDWKASTRITQQVPLT
ncbi:MAG: single-stranded-DNA-specific exonuclease RecJ [Verrucomicrobiota bacterium]|nr:single-stranded-DNA-specific exonuclease RecJ [Verrucomicrobiota bacterium]